MKTIDMPQGFYTLSQDVINPKADRRYKRNLAFQDSWAAGSRWKISHFDHLPSRIESAVGNRLEYDEQVQAILPFLKPATAVLGHFVESGTGRGTEVVLALAVEAGLINLDQVNELAERAEAMDEVEFESLMRRNWLWND